MRSECFPQVSQAFRNPVVLFEILLPSTCTLFYTHFPSIYENINPTESPGVSGISQIFNITMGLLLQSPIWDSWLKVVSQLFGGNNYFKSRKIRFYFTTAITITCSPFIDRALNSVRRKLNDNRRMCHLLSFPLIHW